MRNSGEASFACYALVRCRKPDASHRYGTCACRESANDAATADPRSLSGGAMAAGGSAYGAVAMAAGEPQRTLKEIDALTDASAVPKLLIVVTGPRSRFGRLAST